MRMRKTVSSILTMAILAGGILAAPQSSAREAGGLLSEIEVEVYAEAVSQYVWRGMVITDDPVVQPGLTLSLRGLSFDFWTNLDLTDVNSPGNHYRISEIAYTLSYGFEPADGLDLEFGAILYTFPESGDDPTTELYGSAEFDLPLSPTLTVYRDIDATDGWYVNLAIGRDFALSERLGLELGAGVGWGDKANNDGYFGVNRHALVDMSVSAGLTYVLAEALEATVFVTYSDLIAGELRRAVGRPGNLFGGVGLSYSF